MSTPTEAQLSRRWEGAMVSCNEFQADQEAPL
jgi:hypothetical protein